MKSLVWSIFFFNFFFNCFFKVKVRFHCYHRNSIELKHDFGCAMLQTHQTPQNKQSWQQQQQRGIVIKMYKKRTLLKEK